MSILSQDYERLQNVSIENDTIVDDYQQAFNEGNITNAQQIANTRPFLAMKADKLNNLVDTINYMQQFWANDKVKFENWLRGMMEDVTVYNPSQTYNVGEVVYYNDVPYFCIMHNTTGVFDKNKWLLLQLNDMGVSFKGKYDSSVTYNIGDITYLTRADNIADWQYYNGNSWTPIANTVPNIRYLTNESDSYTFEIYMIDRSRGGV